MGQLEGMVPDGVRSLKGALRQAEVSLDAIGEELWNILRGAWLSTASADTIRQTAAWAGTQGPEINKRLLLLERMELARPELFGAGKPPISVDDSMLAPGAVLPTAGGFWDRVGQHLQATFDPNLNSGDPLTENVKGAVESVTGLGKMVIDYSPTRAVVDFMGWQRSLNDLGRSLAAAIQNPGEFAKAALDWDTWVSNPDRAFGRLIPDIVAAVTTAGTSSGASATSRAVGALGRAAKSVIRPEPSDTRALSRLSDANPSLHDGGRPAGNLGEPGPAARPDTSSGNGPTATSKNPTAADPLDDALRHTSNADGRAWARDNLPLPDLTKEELRALRFYGGPGYMDINPALRAKDADPNVVWSPEIADDIAAMDRAIAKSHLPSDVVLHRGVGSKLLESLGVDINSTREMQQLRGRVISEPGYLSTSAGRRAGFEGDVRVMLRVPKGHEALNMYPITGLSAEREILLRRGTSYIVRGVYRKDGQWYMEADVVPDGWTKPPDWDSQPSMDADLGWKGPFDD
ncbi:ADP-ribosyltransferase [Nonomuraea angiospora]|uniref:ADP-ribosyltransferase n=1 Tax=Nonomuraea angiospora TaxID=46172 RepID=UPI00344FACDA